MFGYDNIKVCSVCIGDPGADAKIALMRAPNKIEISSIKFVDGIGLTAGAGTSIVLTVYNGGTSGTAQTVVGSAYGGTTVDFTVQVPYTMNLAADKTLDSGSWLWVDYAETGTVAPALTINVEYRDGVGE